MTAKYDKIGVQYNQTRKPDPYLLSRLQAHLKPVSQGLYLDIGCGTGNYTSMLQQRGFKFIGIDPSSEMLSKAKANNASVDWRVGTAENINLPDRSIDGIIASLTIHHWSDLNRAFQNLAAVLKEEARVVIFTSTPAQMKGYWLHHYFPKMMLDSMVQMPSLEKVLQAMNNAGIELLSTEKYAVKPDLQDQFLYCGKEQPSLYLDAAVRNGISSFSSLAHKKEVAEGLQLLQTDLNSGAVYEVMKAYENDWGDYLYIIGEKTVV